MDSGRAPESLFIANLSHPAYAMRFSSYIRIVSTGYYLQRRKVVYDSEERSDDIVGVNSKYLDGNFPCSLFLTKNTSLRLMLWAGISPHKVFSKRSSNCKMIKRPISGGISPSRLFPCNERRYGSYQNN